MPKEALATHVTRDLWEATAIKSCGFPAPTAHPVGNRGQKKGISDFVFCFPRERESELARLKVLYEQGASGLQKIGNELARMIRAANEDAVNPTTEAMRIINSVIMASGHMTRDNYVGLRQASKSHREEGTRHGKESG